MRQDILQAFAVSVFANEALRQPEPDKTPEMRVSHSLFRNVYEVAFDRKDGRQYGAEGVAQWVRRLHREGVERTRIYGSCSFDGAQADSEPWGIITDGERGLELWQPKWRHRPVAKSDPQPYIVVYTGERISRFNLDTAPTMEDAEQRLVRVLEKSFNSLKADSQVGFSKLIEECLLKHREQSREFDSCRDLVPNSLPHKQSALAASALRVASALRSEEWRAGMETNRSLKFIAESLWFPCVAAFQAVSDASGYPANAEKMAS